MVDGVSSVSRQQLRPCNYVAITAPPRTRAAVSARCRTDRRVTNTANFIARICRGRDSESRPCLQACMAASRLASACHAARLIRARQRHPAPSTYEMDHWRFSSTATLWPDARLQLLVTAGIHDLIPFSSILAFTTRAQSVTRADTEVGGGS